MRKFQKIILIFTLSFYSNYSYSEGVNPVDICKIESLIASCTIDVPASFLTAAKQPMMLMMRHSRFLNNYIIPVIKEYFPELDTNPGSEEYKAFHELSKNALDSMAIKKKALIGQGKRNNDSFKVTVTIEKDDTSKILRIADAGTGFKDLKDGVTHLINNKTVPKSTKSATNASVTGGQGIGMTQVVNTFAKKNGAVFRRNLLNESNEVVGAEITIKFLKECTENCPSNQTSGVSNSGMNKLKQIGNR